MLWNAHIDYITTTWPENAWPFEGTLGERMLGFVSSLSQYKGKGVLLERWAWQGYIGWSVEGISWGERFDGWIMRVSGFLAQEYWASGLPTGHNVSRLDVCVDVWWGEAPDTMIAEHNVQTLDARMLANSRPWKVACVNGFGAGDTLYIGSRASEVFARIYNKELESDGDETYKGCTRYEIEFKDVAAAAVVSRRGSQRNDRAGLADEVAGILRRRGVGVLDNLLASGFVSPTIGRITTSDERKLDWLRKQVSPSVRSLLTRHDKSVILAALGFDVSS